jgi:hypothetical protein
VLIFDPSSAGNYPAHALGETITSTTYKKRIDLTANLQERSAIPNFRPEAFSIMYLATLDVQNPIPSLPVGI